MTAALLLALSSAAFAHLNVGDPAPTFTAQSTLGGNVSTFDLKAALKKGPVVLYFYPEAFTEGCTIEAHDFAAAMDDYHKLGATVVGLSGDDLAKLQKFSVSECRGKFAVASDAQLKIAKRYDAVLAYQGTNYANRVSYVIGRDGKIAYVYESLEPDKHVANTLEALKKLK